jgi:iron complex outermembrane receptor protein
MTTPFRKSLFASTVLFSSMALITPAIAQTPAVPAEEAPEDVIIVTGSRIANPSATSASPLQVVNAEQIRQSGAVNIQDVLLQNPVFGTPGISRTNSSFATQSAGVATVDLRNLGSDRTLTLVNGRRFVAGVPGSAAVDLNVIPTQFLERVDVLTGGASAVYGSDAVAGVVNFVYKTKFDGIEADAQTGISDYGDGFDRQVNLLVGKNFADGRGNIMLFAGYSKQGTVLKKDRFTEGGHRRSTRPASAVKITGNDSGFVYSRCVPSFRATVPRGRYYTDNNVFTYGQDGALRNCVSTNGMVDASMRMAALPGRMGFNRSDVSLSRRAGRTLCRCWSRKL